jgi:hypothetical protein
MLSNYKVRKCFSFKFQSSLCYDIRTGCFCCGYESLLRYSDCHVIFVDPTLSHLQIINPSTDLSQQSNKIEFSFYYAASCFFVTFLLVLLHSMYVYVTNDWVLIISKLILNSWHECNCGFLLFCAAALYLVKYYWKCNRA